MPQEIVVIGSGMAGLSAAALLAHNGHSITLLEKNWLPGGCAGSFPRKGYIFEAGATTLVGFDPGMPLRYLLDETGIVINPWELDVPMQVHLKTGEVLTRWRDLDRWIEEAEQVFGKKGQRPFWEYCYKVSQFVWDTSLRQRIFPPEKISDLWYAAKNFQWKQLNFAALAFRSVKDLMRQYGLLENARFRAFVNEQLLITAQNYLDEVNILFGATALCYTNYGNYYMPGGLMSLADPLVLYLERAGARLSFRNGVKTIIPVNGHYEVVAEKDRYRADKVISAIPLNDTLDLYDSAQLRAKYHPKALPSDKLNGAFTLGFVVRRREDPSCLHHQIHLDEPLPGTGSHSIFLSYSHPDDHQRCGPDELVCAISTHVSDPANTLIEDSRPLEEAIYAALEKHDLIRREDILYAHSSTPGSWQKWTGRAWGFVGGYPQYLSIKPWQMMGHRLDRKGAYICGDSTYPGQGIPGASLSGIVAAEKVLRDLR